MPELVDARPLVAALEAAITGQGVAYGDGEKPTATAGHAYVVGWPDSGTVDDRSLKSRDGFSLLAPLQVYGFDPDSVRWAVGKVRAAMFGLHGTTVAGRTVQMPSHFAGPLSRDDDADPPIWMQYEEFRLRLS